jgi:hypothetical protein
MKSFRVISYINVELVPDVSDTVSPSLGDDVMSVCLHAMLIYSWESTSDESGRDNVDMSNRLHIHQYN